MDNSETTKGSILKNTVAILFGFFFAFAVIGVFVFASAFINLSGNKLMDIFLLAVPCFLGGFATAGSAANFKLLCTFISSIIIVSLLTVWLKFNLIDNNYPKNYTEIVISIVFCLLGGFVGRNRKLL